MDVFGQFAVFYGDESFLEFEGSKIFDAPRTNVQAIAQSYNNTWHTVSHADFYVWDPDMGFYGVDESGFWQYLFTPGLHIVFCGKTIKTPVFQKIFQDALAYADRKRRDK